MTTQEQLVRIYDRSMFSRKQRRYYGGSNFYNFGYWERGARNQHEASVALVDRLLEKIPDRSGRILDVACGMGASTRHLLNFWPAENVTGINISDVQLAQARQNAPGVTFLKMDAARLDFPDGHFDAVLCVEAAFHFNTRDAFVREAFRVLKPGGRLVLSDILFRSWVTPFSDRLSVPSPNLVPDIGAYRDRLTAAGFVDTEVEDKTDECLGAFRRSVSAWVWSEENAHDKRYFRKTLMSLAAKALAGYFGATSKNYLLVAATKPGA